MKGYEWGMGMDGRLAVQWWARFSWVSSVQFSGLHDHGFRAPARARPHSPILIVNVGWVGPQPYPPLPYPLAVYFWPFSFPDVTSLSPPHLGNLPSECTLSVDFLSASPPPASTPSFPPSLPPSPFLSLEPGCDCWQVSAGPCLRLPFLSANVTAIPRLLHGTKQKGRHRQGGGSGLIFKQPRRRA